MTGDSSQIEIMSRILVYIVLLSSLLTAGSVQAQQKRAVLVGINDYSPEASEDGSSGIALRKWKDLKGAVNDVEAMSLLLSSRFAFDEITLLTNKDAKRAAIFQAIDQLVADSKPGDVALFYYAGHGSQMKNTGSSEADGLDETIVPWDVVLGEPDIRDKELRDAFNKLIDKGALVTLIFDSCHSGSITRGIAGGETRYLAPSPIVIHDESNPPLPVDRGALVLSAAQDDELAKEMLDDEGLSRGAFSWALNQALLAGEGRSVESLFLQVRARMKSLGVTQEPVLAGLEERQKQPLFGGISTEAEENRVLVLKTDASDVHLQGGLATGIKPGTELKSEAGDAFIVVQSLGLSASIAEPVDHSNLPSPGDALRITRWVSSAEQPLRLFIPEGLSYDQVTKVAQRFADAGSVSDPTEQWADRVLLFNESSWTFSTSEGEQVDLGTDPSAAQLSDVLDGDNNLFFPVLPPFAAFRQRLMEDLKTGGRLGNLVERPEDAEYVLVGRLNDGELQYAWVHRAATTGPTDSPLPARSDWYAVTEDRFFASSLLAENAAQLDVIWGWINMTSPPEDAAFPYQIAGFENIKTGEIRASGDSLNAGDQYRVVLQASTKDIQDAQMQAVINNVTKRFLYVFALDQYGNGSLLYPGSGQGNVENDINFFTMLPEQLVLPSDGPLFTVSKPLGIDTFFLLSSSEPLPQPEILSFSGIRTRSTPEGETTELANLLFNMGGGKRSERKPVPLNWSIEKISVRTLE